MDDHSTDERQDTGDEHDRPPDGAQHDTVNDRNSCGDANRNAHLSKSAAADVVTQGGKAAVLTDDNRLQPTVKTGHVGKTKLIKSDTNPAKDELCRPTDRADGAHDGNKRQVSRKRKGKPIMTTNVKMWPRELTSVGMIKCKFKARRWKGKTMDELRMRSHDSVI